MACSGYNYLQLLSRSCCPEGDVVVDVGANLGAELGENADHTQRHALYRPHEDPTQSLSAREWGVRARSWLSSLFVPVVAGRDSCSGLSLLLVHFVLRLALPTSDCKRCLAAHWQLVFDGTHAFRHSQSRAPSPSFTVRYFTQTAFHVSGMGCPMLQPQRKC